MNDGNVRIPDLIITVCWALFWAYWLISARTAKRALPTGRGVRGFTGSRVAVVVIAVFLARALGFRMHPAHNGAAATGVGLAVFFLGLALAVWARVYIGRNWGMPMTRKEDPELVTTGPYSRVRHPIYTGIILAAIGTSLAISVYGLIAVAALAALFIYSATREEAYLAEQFPSTYPAYKRSTKMLIPFIY